MAEILASWRPAVGHDADSAAPHRQLPFLVHWIIREEDLAGKRFDRVKTYAEDLFA